MDLPPLPFSSGSKKQSRRIPVGSRAAGEGEAVEKRAQCSPFLCLQAFCSTWPRFLGFRANSNSFCHLLSFPFSRERGKKKAGSDGPKGGPATW